MNRAEVARFTPAEAPRYDAVVVGGGFYGLSVALALRRHVARVLVLEKGDELLGRASFVNQARVHNGYHYPRSLLTAMRARASYQRFVADFPECIDDRFDKYYAVARRMSKVTARQFAQFCARIGAPLRPADAEVRRLFDPHMVEEVFAVTECAFDAGKLRAAVAARADAAGVEVRAGVEALRVVERPGGPAVVECRGRDGGELRVAATLVFNCTYSRINRLLEDSGLPRVPLRHQLAEMAIVEVPEHLRRMGITVMDGPFFSVMPFPALGFHSMSHVRYTHHHHWSDDGAAEYMDADRYLRSITPRTRFDHMLRDARRYIPSLAGTRYERALFDVKTLLPRSSLDDSRPILLHRDAAAPHLFSVLGAKIDSVYDVQESLDQLFARGEAAA